MTLQQLFDLSTIEHRHLLLAYLLVALVQLGFLLVTLRALRRSSTAADSLPSTPDGR